MDQITLDAPAKINLSLDITGLREDGYHELEMIMQSISLSDIIRVKKIRSGIDIHCSDKRIPENKDNLAYKAAQVVLDKYKIDSGVEINIKKNIPLAAGLAGGSTDAAAVLKAVDSLYRLNISREKFYVMARKIGSDVSFCLYGGTAFASGRGDILKQLPDLKKIWLVLIKPSLEVSTPEIYKSYDKRKIELNIPTARLVDQLKGQANVDWSAGFANVLEKVTEEKIREIKTIKKKLASFDPEFILMSGSGPTVFAIVEDEAKAEEIVEKWPGEDDFIVKSHTTNYKFPTLDIGEDIDDS